MKLKDFVYDSDQKLAILWLTDIVEPELQKLLEKLEGEPNQSQDEVNYDTIIFEGE